MVWTVAFLYISKLTCTALLQLLIVDLHARRYESI
jgi:hypothetical protein